MATYPVIHITTGEQKEVEMSIHDWDQWKKDNPEWTRDWSDPSTCPSSGEVGEQLRRKKPISLDLLKDILPLTDNQERLFNAYEDNKNLVAYGAAGTGKTFITLYNALCDVLDERSPYEKIYLVRSLVPTREIGFLPGSHDDKADLYQIPYKNMVKAMFDVYDEAAEEMLYANLKTQGTISFWSTSFIRGTTFENAIIIVDEYQNLNFHELDSIITRVGENSKIMFCGDTKQSDLTKQYEKTGVNDFMRILQLMPSIEMIHFEIEDIVRSGFVKEYLTKKTELDL
jgi:predicted ribonuclease YlaK